MINYVNNECKLGVVIGYLNFAVKMATQFLYVPIMLSILGQSEYGVYQLVASIISYLGLLNFGFGGAYLKFYAQCKDDSEEEAKLNGTFLFVFSIFSLLVLIIGILISLNAETILGDKLTANEISLSKVLLFILAINMALTFPTSVFSSIVSSREKFIFQKLVELLKNIASPFLMILVLFIGKGSIGLVVITTILTIISGIVNIWYVKEKIKAKFTFNGIDIRLIKEIGAFSFFIFLNSIIDQINWNVDKYLLGRMVGSIAIAIYSVGAQINTIYMQVSDMTASVMATKVNLIVAEEKNPLYKLNILFRKVGRIQGYVILAVISGFYILGKDFIILWAGVDYLEAYYVTLLLIVPAAFPLIQSLGVDIQRALNKHQIRSIIYTGLSIANILISIPLISTFGASGAALGTAVSLLIGNGLVMNIIYKNYIGLDIASFWKDVFPIIISSLIPTVMIGILNNYLVSVTWFNLIIKGSLFLVIYFIAEYCLAMNKEEKDMISGMLILKRRGKSK